MAFNIRPMEDIPLVEVYFHCIHFKIWPMFVLNILRYDHEGNKKVEQVLVKEIRGNFGKEKWVKAETALSETDKN